jgi:hypothetical protein
MYFKRAKIFLAQDANGGEQRYLAPVGGPVAVPNWVCKTMGYKLGVKDGSIVDVTPPKVIAPIVEEDAPEPVPAKDQDGPPKDDALPTDDAPEGEEEPEEPEAEEAPKAKVPKSSRAGKGTIR